MSQFKLSILICTINDRITAVPDMLLPPCEEVCYVISMQYTDDLFLSQIPSVLYERRMYLYIRTLELDFRLIVTMRLNIVQQNWL